MKKLVTIALLAAMLLSCFAGCAMQKGELDVEGAAYENVAFNAADAGIKSQLRAEVDKANAYYANGDAGFVADKWDGTTDKSWYKADDATKTYTITKASELEGFRQLIMDGVNFSGWTIKLGANFDFDGKSLAGISKIFAGNFDGCNHVIANYTMSLAKESGFFGTIGDKTANATEETKATVANFALVNISCIAKGATVASVSANVKYWADVTNVYSDAVFSVSSSKALTKVGGINANMTGSGTKTFTNCEFSGSIDLKDSTVSGMGQYAAGMSCTVNGGTVQMTNCSVSGKITANIDHVAGFIAYNSSVGSITFINCVNSADISGTSNVGGFMGRNKKNEGKGDLIIINSANKGNVTGESNVGGMIGRINYTPVVTVEGFSNTGDVTAVEYVGGFAGRWSYCPEVSFVGGEISGTITATGDEDTAARYAGGLVGNTTEAATSLEVLDSKFNATINSGFNSGGAIGFMQGNIKNVTFKNITVGGTLNVTRSTAGVVGYLTCGNATFENIKVTANLNFDLSDYKNQNAGGVIGRVHVCAALTLDTIVVESVINAKFNAAAVPAESDDDPTTYVGGLIGYVHDTKVDILIRNAKVGAENEAASMILTNTNPAVAAYAGVYVGGAEMNPETNARATFTYEKLFNNVLPIITGEVLFDVAGPNAKIGLNTTVVGYQQKDNGDGTYDLRYVMAAEDVFNGLGVSANIRFVDETGAVKEKNFTSYVSTVYLFVMSEEAVLAAEDYGYDYLYTLVVKGIPSAYSIENGNMQVAVTPFGATGGDGFVNVENGCSAVHGVDLVVSE